jgi:hypothetical protein
MSVRIEFETTTMPDSRDCKQINPTCSLVEQAIVLAGTYNEMLVQADEVNLRIHLWRESLESCRADSDSTSCTSIQ